MSEEDSFSKQFGKTLAVDDPSFTVHSGRVTGFLGPNGADDPTSVEFHTTGTPTLVTQGVNP